MENINLEDENVIKYLKENGFTKEEIVEDVEKYQIVLKDGFIREFRWSHAAFLLIIKFVETHQIENFDPSNDMLHLTVFSYAMLLADMEKSGNKISFERYCEIFPRTPKGIRQLAEKVLTAFDEQNDLVL